VYANLLEYALNPRNLLQYLWEIRERWAYKECKDKNYGDDICITDSMLECPVEEGCIGTGLILNPKYAKWVEFMDAIEVVKGER
jgi:hypothetical protein